MSDYSGEGNSRASINPYQMFRSADTGPIFRPAPIRTIRRSTPSHSIPSRSMPLTSTRIQPIHSMPSGIRPPLRRIETIPPMCRFSTRPSMRRMASVDVGVTDIDFSRYDRVFVSFYNFIMNRRKTKEQTEVFLLMLTAFSRAMVSDNRGPTQYNMLQEIATDLHLFVCSC